jgi:hypothetical protein
MCGKFNWFGDVMARPDEPVAIPPEEQQPQIEQPAIEEPEGEEDDNYSSVSEEVPPNSDSEPEEEEDLHCYSDQI